MKYILRALTTEKAVSGIEMNNSLTFVVMEEASKADVKKEVEADFEESVVKVNICITPDGRKKAIVKFSKDGAAADIASKLKVI